MSIFDSLKIMEGLSSLETNRNVWSFGYAYNQQTGHQDQRIIYTLKKMEVVHGISHYKGADIWYYKFCPTLDGTVCTLRERGDGILYNRTYRKQIEANQIRVYQSNNTKIKEYRSSDIDSEIIAEKEQIYIWGERGKDEVLDQGRDGIENKMVQRKFGYSNCMK
eukprot:164695_1